MVAGRITIEQRRRGVPRVLALSVFATAVSIPMVGVFTSPPLALLLLLVLEGIALRWISTTPPPESATIRFVAQLRGVPVPPPDDVIADEVSFVACSECGTDLWMPKMVVAMYVEQGAGVDFRCPFHFNLPPSTTLP
jgi:hypothetical protein